MISRDEIELGRLPGPIGTDDGMGISLLDFERDPIHGPELTKVLCDSLRLQKHIRPDFRF